MASGIRFGDLPPETVHLCVDMQTLFAEGPWATPWMPRVLPVVIRLCEHGADRNWFTRFIPAPTPEDAPGAWKGYWRRWPMMTLDRLAPGATDLVPPLRRFARPARTVDKTAYSPWIGTDLARALTDDGVSTLVLTGAETDMCVLATALGAVDLGFRVVIVADAVCSSSDQAHDGLIRLYHQRFGQQIEIAPSQEVLAAWP